VNKEKESKKGKEKDKEAAKEGPKLKPVPPRLRVRYFSEIVPALQKRFNLKNVMEVPRLEKVVLNMGMGKAVAEPKLIEEAVGCLRDISGQKPVITKAKKAISNFKLRQNQAIGCKVTLRGSKMYEFMDRLIAIAIPRIRDFRGLSRKCLDGHGNYTLGIKEQIVFMEIDRDKVSHVTGLDVCICTTARTDELALGLLEEIGMPFRKS
jgi:large subunit ribosomal protein L5